MSDREVRVRVAPSPTGDPHVGTAYQALFNCAFARGRGGKFVLRIEDTDRARSTRQSEQAILESLRWLGLQWDEGPDVGGPHGPYRQSERIGIYRRHIDQLLETGDAYRCFCTKERLDEMRNRRGAETGYDRLCRGLSLEESRRRTDAGEPFVVRMKVPLEGECLFNDLLRGEIRKDWASSDDQIILKSDGFPTYHLANVVDDHLMDISHVIRGEEWINSVPKHVKLYEYFGWEAPVFCHLPLLRNNDKTKSKLSKRKNPTSINYYRRAGFLPEAVLNFLGMMGWLMPNGEEKFTLEEMCRNLELEKISLGGPVFDVAKLRWLNGRYIREDYTPAALREQLENWALNREKIERIVPLVHPRLETLADWGYLTAAFFADDVPFDPQDLKMKGKTAEELAAILQMTIWMLEQQLDFSAGALEALFREFAGKFGVKLRELTLPFYVALSGRRAWTPLFDSMEILGSDMVRMRLRRAVEALGGISAKKLRALDKEYAALFGRGSFGKAGADPAKAGMDAAKAAADGTAIAADPAKGGNDRPLDFIRSIVAQDLQTGKHGGRVQTRFPPEPNGYLHIGHAKAICLDFGIALENMGLCNLRFDDTNPIKEESHYVEGMKRDIRWLGFDWGDRLYYASDYFAQLYDYAEQLIRIDRAYVCDLSAEEIREYRGTLTQPGRDSPHRNRSLEENLDLFRRMRAGEFPDGSRVLRAKIDMAAPNLNMRDPVIYRILRATHHRTGDKWCIYPMYDYTHCLSDSIEGITHSLCSLEFEDHRPLYDWFLDELQVACHPQQIEFARLNLSRTIVSKRRLRQLVEGGHVGSWDDPRMPTLCGMRRRGYSPQAIRNFCDAIGVAKRDSVVAITMLEHFLREDLNKHSPRAMGVLRPLRVIIDNYPEDQVEELDAINNPEDTSAGKRKVPFSRVLYIEREDFREDPPSKFFRLAPGREVRLRYAYLITCERVVKDQQTGEVIQLHCTYDPATKGGNAPDGRKVKATLHWVSAAHALDAEVRLYDYLFKEDDPDGKGHSTDLASRLNPDSLKILTGCKVEPGLAAAAPGTRLQFERQGYFCVDSDSSEGALIFNRTVSLRDSWAKIEKALKGKK